MEFGVQYNTIVLIKIQLKIDNYIRGNRKMISRRITLIV